MITRSKTYLRFLTHNAKKYPTGYARRTTATETVNEVRIDFQNRPV
jgi:hypothetical protein